MRQVLDVPEVRAGQLASQSQVPELLVEAQGPEEAPLDVARTPGGTS